MLDRNRANCDDVGLHSQQQAGVHELTRPERTVRVGERSFQFDRSGGAINRVIWREQNSTVKFRPLVAGINHDVEWNCADEEYDRDKADYTAELAKDFAKTGQTMQPLLEFTQ
jgi:hypothetical protein